MPEDVEIAVIRSYLEEHVIWTIPLVQNLFHEELTVPKPKPNGPFVRFSARVALHLERHPVLPVQKSSIFAVHDEWIRSHRCCRGMRLDPRGGERLAVADCENALLLRQR